MCVREIKIVSFSGNNAAEKFLIRPFMNFQVPFKPLRRTEKKTVTYQTNISKNISKNKQTSLIYL